MCVCLAHCAYDVCVKMLSFSLPNPSTVSVNMHILFHLLFFFFFFFLIQFMLQNKMHHKSQLMNMHILVWKFFCFLCAL